ncbi:hypothetical protein Ancab_018082 [Ancistrocladus abbreviatus]
MHSAANHELLYENLIGNLALKNQHIVLVIDPMLTYSSYRFVPMIFLMHTGLFFFFLFLLGALPAVEGIPRQPALVASLVVLH